MSLYLIDVRSIDQKVKLPLFFCFQGREKHIKSEIIGKGGTLLPFLVFPFPGILYIIPGIDYDIVFSLLLYLRKFPRIYYGLEVSGIISYSVCQ
jgi:hypothetical protein